MTETSFMHMVSVLFPASEIEKPHVFPDQDPAYFEDLAIGRILDSVTKTYEAYDLRPFFRFIPHQQDIVEYRNEILQDLSGDQLGGIIRAFRDQMTIIRSHLGLADKSFNQYQAAFFSLLAISTYCQAVRELDDGLAAARPASAGLQAFAASLHDYAMAAGFQALVEQAAHHQAALATIRYTVLLNESTITVRSFEEEPDYDAIITALFARFHEGQDVKAEKSGLESGVWIGNVQSRILDGVARINPEVFSALCEFTARGAGFIDPVLSRFERETQFYASWIGFTRQFSAVGLVFSTARLVTDHDVYAQAAFDLALADKLCASGQTVITNDFYLTGVERIFVITGPNQGGKTTFARTFGQMHYFANLGLSVPGQNVRLQFFDRIFTHFEREEALTALHGKLYDDLVRVRAILTAATSDSLIILNEIFNSTSLQDAQFLADKVLRDIIRIGALGVCVTFMDELAKLGPQTVSLTSMVEPNNPAKRSFHVVRREADGLAYALSIAKKYGVTYEQLKERLV